MITLGNATDLLPFARASQGAYFGADSVLRTAAIDALRLDYDMDGVALGALVEGASTNLMRNSVAQGAVAGTPGTMPTNWSVFTGGNGVSSAVVGSGVEDGIPYVDVRFFGTPTASNALGVYTGINAAGYPAAFNDVWTYSYCMRLVGGSLANLGFASWIWFQPGNGNLPSIAVVPTNAPLRTQRNTITRTLTNAGTTAVFTQIRSNYFTGQTIDVTLRIGLPQLEKAERASSFIATAGSAATRAMDLIALPVSNFPYNPAESTLLVDCLVPGRVAATGSRALISIDTGSGGLPNRLLAYLQPGGYIAARVSGPTSNATLDNWTPPDGLNVERIRVGIGAKVGSAYIACNGAAAPIQVPPEMPTGALSLKFGNAMSNTLPLNGIVKRALYLPRQMSQAELMAWTAQP